MKRDFALILLSLLVAAFIDHWTGPLVSASAFYIFPVALASWRLGWKYGLTILTLAMLLNIHSDWSRPASVFPRHILMLNEFLRLIVFLAVCGLSILLRRDHRTLEEHEQQLMSLNEQLEEEMRAAGAIQMLLVGGLPRHPSLDLATHFQSSRILGGDIIHLSLLSENRLAVAIGDVSGKGSPAALAGAVTLGLLHDSPARWYSPAETLQKLNQQLVGYLPEEMFITFFYALLDLTSGDFVYAHAGHEPPFLIQPEGSTSVLPGGGFPLGIFPDAEYQDHRQSLSPGDLLFCYTDGLTDLVQPSGERMGMESLQQQVELRARFPCDLLVRNILQEAVGENRDLADDISIVAIRYRQ